MLPLLQKLRERFNRPHEQPDDPDNPSPRKPAITLAAVLLLVAAAIWVVWSIPHRVVQRRMDAAHPLTVDKQLDLEDAYRKTITQIVLSVFGLYILYLSYRRAEAGDKTVRIMEQGHITDRFTKAIEQLGKTDGDKPNIEVRLGAIYALERIAIDSERDHWTIMEILTAYVRQNAPLQGLQEKPRTDIQAILTVLGRRRTGSRREKEGQRLDLSGSHLAGANLREANLQRVLLHGANLQRADLYKANLQEIAMDRADLKHAYLGKANLQGAFIQVSFMQEVNLADADLRGAEFRMVEMQEAHLVQADLRKAQLYSSNLQEANLYQANLEEANLGGVVLQDAILTEANLRDALEMTADQVKAAAYWERAHYSPAFRAALGLPTQKQDPPTL